MRRYFALVEFEPGCAWSVRFPDLPNVFSASDEAENIVRNAIEALQCFAWDEPLPEPLTYDQVVALPEVKEALAEGCYLIQVPFIDVDTDVVRANVTFERGLLRAIDDEAGARGLTRSAFLAGAARREIEQGH